MNSDYVYIMSTVLQSLRDCHSGVVGGGVGGRSSPLKIQKGIAEN